MIHCEPVQPGMKSWNSDTPTTTAPIAIQFSYLDSVALFPMLAILLEANPAARRTAGSVHKMQAGA